MTTEIRTIQIEAYRDPEGRPTCGTRAGCCKMIVAIKFGTLQACAVNGHMIGRDNDGYGHPRPVEGCPVWGGEE